eukprot:Rmarinus@m.3616
MATTSTTTKSAAIRRKKRKARKRRAKKTDGDNDKKEVKGTLALEYLEQWDKDRKNWKFQKVRQTWLLQHMFNPDSIHKTHFPVLLRYINGLQGVAREATLTRASEVVKEVEDKEEESRSKADRKKLKRAHKILALFQEEDSD